MTSSPQIRCPGKRVRLHWRLQHTWRTRGKQEAKNVAGMTDQALESALGVSRALKAPKQLGPKGTRKPL